MAGFVCCAHCVLLSHFLHLLSQDSVPQQVDYIDHARTPHQPTAVVASYSRPFIFTTPPSETRFCLSTLELLPRLPFPVPTGRSCGNLTGSPAHRVVRSYFGLSSIKRQCGDLSDATPNPTPGVAQPSLAISFVSRSATPSNDVSTTNAQEEVHPVLPQLVSLRRSCPICFAELTEHKHRGARLHNTGVHATIAAEPEAYAAIHKAKTCKRCWSQRAERTKYWLGHCEHLSGTQKVQ